MVTPTPTLIPLPILISEVFPKPSQGEEWVELYNPNATAVNLSGWELWDELSQPSLIFSFTTQTIGGNQWIVVPINRKLNDSEDGVLLKDATNTTRDSMHYVGSETDMSWARLGTSISSPWSQGAVSPGTSNPIPTVTPLPTITPVPTVTTTPIPQPTSTTAPSQSPTTAPTSIQQTIHSSAKTQPQLKTATQMLMTPSQSLQPTPTPFTPTPTLIPTISLEKSPPSPKNAQTESIQQPLLYFLGLSLIQLSAIGMNRSKQGMIQPDVLAHIS